MKNLSVKTALAVITLILAASFPALAGQDMSQFTATPNAQGGTNFTATHDVQLSQPLVLGAHDQINITGDHSVMLNTLGVNFPQPTLLFGPVINISAAPSPTIQAVGGGTIQLPVTTQPVGGEMIPSPVSGPGQLPTTGVKDPSFTQPVQVSPVVQPMPVVPVSIVPPKVPSVLSTRDGTATLPSTPVHIPVQATMVNIPTPQASAPVVQLMFRGCRVLSERFRTWTGRSNSNKQDVT